MVLFQYYIGFSCIWLLGEDELGDYAFVPNDKERWPKFGR